MRRPRFRFSLRRMLGWIAVIGCVAGLLAAFERESIRVQCGTPFIEASVALFVCSVGYLVFRLVMFAIRHPS